MQVSILSRVEVVEFFPSMSVFWGLLLGLGALKGFGQRRKGSSAYELRSFSGLSVRNPDFIAIM